MTTRKRKLLTEEQKARRAEYQREWRKSQPDYYRRRDTLYRHGITLQEYDTLLLIQEGRCAICGTDTPGGRGGFHVDHNHDTGGVRGLLCYSCNVSLGGFKDSPAILARAIEYLTDNGHYGPKETEGVAETLIN